MSEAIWFEDQDSEFVIDDDGKADWAIRKIQDARDDTEKWAAFYEEKLKQIKARNLFREGILTRKLQEYFETVPHHETRTQQSYSLPSGKLLRKNQTPKFTTDDKALVPWLKQNGLERFVQVKESAMWGELKKIVCVKGENVVTEDGEIIPGISVEERAPIFELQIKKGDEA